MLKILTVVGARPQFVKSAVCSRTFAVAAGVQEFLVHTEQHYDDNLSAVFFEELGIPEPSHRLGIGSGSHGAQTGAMLAALEDAMLQTSPDVVLVYGDTNSTLAGGLAAAKLDIPVAHVEAGLRSFNRRMPEEVNRVLTDHLSNWLFTPTPVATGHLAREGITGSRVLEVGDVMLEATRLFGELSRSRAKLPGALGLAAECYVLATVHRAENTDDPERLAAIAEALTRIGATIPVVLPLHPRTRARLAQAGRLEALADPQGPVRLVDPVGYLDMVALVRGAAAVVTDSGGLQKEAYFLERPCVTVRRETEWVELLDAGWNTLVDPADADGIVMATLAAPGRRGDAVALYGAGDTSERILEALRGPAPAIDAIGDPRGDGDRP